MSSALSTPVRHWRVALLLAGGVLFAPSRAAAECGDYITIKHQSHTDSEYPESHDTSPIKRPCHGPNCSTSPVRDFPPLAPVIPVVSRAKELAQPIEMAGKDTTQTARLSRDDSSPRPIHRTTSIFHPPRHG